MSSQSDTSGGPTTSAEDQAKAAALKKRLREGEAPSSSSSPSASSLESATKLQSSSQSFLSSIPSVELPEGRGKYVLIRAKDKTTGQQKDFVRMNPRASYHVEVAEPFLAVLNEAHLHWLELEQARIEGEGKEEGSTTALKASTKLYLQKSKQVQKKTSEKSNFSGREGISCEVLGGGRIIHSPSDKSISIYGFSYGFPWKQGAGNILFVCLFFFSPHLLFSFFFI